jgi:hypothetical protein
MGDTDTEFAILLNSKVVSKTSENVKITKKVDHAYYLVGPDIDWKNTIDQWIAFYLSNKYASLFASTTDSNIKKTTNINATCFPFRHDSTCYSGDITRTFRGSSA